jgi:transaldolase
VVTCPPKFIDEVINLPDAPKIKFEKDCIHRDIPKDVMDKLMRVPYFERAYAEDGYTRDEYNQHPALERTAAQFSKATQDMVDFADKCVKAGACSFK